MKLGIVGTGLIATEFVQECHAELGFEGTWLLSTERSYEKACTLAENHALEGVVTSMDDLLAKDVDTIYIAVPNHLHHRFALQALRAGKNVICEKPMTSTLAEFTELRAEAKRQDVLLIEAVTVHQMPAFKALRSRLGELGAIKIVSLNYSQYSRRYDAFKAGEVLSVFDPAKSGGALMDLNLYNLQFVTGLFGEPQAVSYLANVERGIDVSGIATLDYGTFKGCCIGAKDCKAPVVSCVEGDAGCAVVRQPVGKMESFELLFNDGREETVNLAEGRFRMAYEFEEFARMIDEHDVGAAEELLDISEAVCRMMCEMRAQAGVVFAADERR